MTETHILFASIVGFLIVFPVFWICVVWLISRLSGWSRLALTFAATKPASGEVFPWTSARLRFSSSYSNCLTVTVSVAGIHIATWGLFAFGHQPLFLPWDAIGRLVQSRGLLGHTSKLYVRAGSGEQTITLSGRLLADAIAGAAPRRLTRSP